MSWVVDLLAQNAGRDSPDLLLTGARIYTADPNQPWAEALLTRGNRIAKVGAEAEVRAEVHGPLEEIHVAGGLVVPPLNDSHVHMTWGAHALSILDLNGVYDVLELQQKLRAYADRHPERSWIEAYGLPYEPLTGLEMPVREVLDAALPDRPVYIAAFDSHTGWANSNALLRAGIDRGSSIPLPNEVVVDEIGRATGMLKERLAQNLVTRLIETPGAAERDAMLCEAMRFVNGFGITSVQNMDADPERLRQCERLRLGGHLTARSAHYLTIREDTPLEYLEECRDEVRGVAGQRNHASGIKLFIDGVVESKTALMLAPYSDGSGETGVPDMAPSTYRAIVSRAAELGLDVATHAIGDGGVRVAIEAYQAARAVTDSQRLRIEHIEVIDPVDIPRIGRLGITASMQPLHAVPTTDPRFTPWTTLVGPEREKHAFSWRALQQHGARLAFGSDWPIVTPDPRTGLRAAVSRRNRAGEPVGSWHPDQCLTLAEAINAYTRDAAWMERQERHKGVLRPGMLADVTVFEQDLFAVAPDAYMEVEIALTVVDGRVVYRGSDIA